LTLFLKGGWEEGEPLPIPLFRSAAIGIENEIWIFGGQTTAKKGSEKYSHPLSDRVFVMKEIKPPTSDTTSLYPLWGYLIFCVMALFF